MLLTTLLAAAAVQVQAAQPRPTPPVSPELQRRLTCPQDPGPLPAPVNGRRRGAVMQRLGDLPDAHQIRLVWRNHCHQADVVRYNVSSARR